jgi:hypothetical protein
MEVQFCEKRETSYYLAKLPNESSGQPQKNVKTSTSQLSYIQQLTTFSFSPQNSTFFSLFCQKELKPLKTEAYAKPRPSTFLSAETLWCFRREKAFFPSSGKPR